MPKRYYALETLRQAQRIESITLKIRPGIEVLTIIT